MNQKSRFAKSFALLFSTFALITACSSEADIGESCDEPGKADDECKNGGVCGKPSDTSTVFECLKICTKDEECPTGRSCNGVSGTSYKGCRLK